MDMFRFILFVIICIGLSLASCTSQKNEERNMIVFNDPVPVVEDSIRAMQKLLDKLPDADVINYYITNSGKLAVNSETIGKFERLKTNQKMDTIRSFQNFSREESQEFLNLVLFLKKNFIESAYKDLKLNMYLFDYRGMESVEYNSLRELMLVDNKSDTLNGDFISYKRILDRKGKLILVAPKDAVIYE